MQMKHQGLLQRAINAVRSADAASYAQLFAEDAVVYHPLAPEPLRGRFAIQQAEQGMFDAFSEIEVEIVSLLEGEGRAAVEVVLRATHTGPIHLGGGQLLPATGRRIEVPAVWVFELGSDELITVERDYLDSASFMAQLGLTA
jgi:steroid delta-isomerase-like uncharacterized protein